MLLSDSAFLFFKQKTAYDMRISDWSSDVCSSELPSSTPSSGSVPASALRQQPAAEGCVHRRGTLDGREVAAVLDHHEAGVADAGGHRLVVPQRRQRVLTAAEHQRRHPDGAQRRAVVPAAPDRPEERRGGKGG